MAGLLGKAWETLRGVVPGLSRSGAAPESPPDWAEGRGRILLVGPTGAGKSTLVNAVLGEGTAPAGAGAPVTEGTTWYGEGSPLPVALGDTRGLEAAESEAQVANFSASLEALPPGRRPHLVWLVINAEGGRAFAGTGTLAGLASSLEAAGIPALVVLTHAEPGSEGHARLRARIVETMPGAPVVAVNSRALLGEDGAVLLPAHGVEALLALSQPFLPLPA